MMMFFFKLCNLFCLFVIVVLVNMCVVFWNDVVEINDLVVSDVLVILSNLCLNFINGLFLVVCLWFVIFMCVIFICFFLRNFEL